MIIIALTCVTVWYPVHSELRYKRAHKLHYVAATAVNIPILNIPIRSKKHSYYISRYTFTGNLLLIIVCFAKLINVHYVNAPLFMTVAFYEEIVK